MKYSFVTDKGIKRPSNQDCCYAFSPEYSSVFAVVCDGMGGENAGDIASTLAVETVVHRIRIGWHKNMTQESIRNLLLTSITAANICVYDLSQEKEMYSGMGTTIVAAVICDGIVTIAHVGDSRAYLCSDSIRLLTKDHSLVQELVESGKMTPGEAKNSPQKNYITRALGVEESVRIDFNRTELGEGESLLLCSDGLTNFVPEEEMLRIVKENPDDAAKKLIGKANENGGGDNVTVVVVTEEERRHSRG